MRAVLDHIIESITPASEAQAAAVRVRLERAQLGPGLDSLVQVAARLAGARHSPRPSLEHKVAAVVAADHGFASPGIDLGDNNPTTVALRLMAEGGAAINSAARSTETSLMLIDAGVRGGDVHSLGSGVLSFRTGNGTADITRGPAMTIVDAIAALQTGIAITFSLADAGLDILALGHLAVGGQASASAVVCALTSASPETVAAAEDLDVVQKALRCNLVGQASPMEVLTALGGYELGVLSGMVMACASIHVPVVLDGQATSAAALLATAFSQAVRGYLFASHAGGLRAHAQTLEALGLEPLFAVGLSHGEGTGSVLALPMLDAACRVAREVA